MRTSLGYRAVCFFMAFLVFFSGTYAAVGMHFCGGNLMSVSFSGHAETCGMQTMGPADPGCSDFVTHPGHRCCSDVVVVIQGHDALAAALAWHLVPFVGMAAPVADLGFWIPERPVDRIPAHDGHSPPFPEKDIYKIYEAYLI